MTKKDTRWHRIPPAQPLDERQQLGQRLAGARALVGLTLDTASKALGERGYPISRAALGHWEKGTNLPDALWLRRLAKLYGSTLDALVWDDAISMEAIQLAVQYDALGEKQKRHIKAMWLAYFESAKSDQEVRDSMPVTATNPATGSPTARPSGRAVRN